jgi:uncharacterized protein YndB with AHSA1/START domain
MQTTGTYEELAGHPVVRFERTVPHPVQAVWAAITDPAQLQEWFPTTVEFDQLQPGAAISFHFAQDAYPPMHGEVLEVAPPRRLSFTWGDDLLTFELEPSDDSAACRLSLSVVLDSADKAARDAAGWDQCLDMLGVVVDGRTPRRPALRDDWRVYYEEYKRLGLPARAPIPE